MAFDFNSLNIINRISEIEQRLRRAETTVSTHDGNITDIIRDLQNKQGTIENIVKDLQNKQYQLDTQVSQIKQAQDNSTLALGNAQTAYDQASKALSDVQTAYNESMKAQKASQDAFNQATTSMNLSKTNLASNYKQLVSGFSGLSVAGSNLAGEFNAVRARVVEWGNNLRAWANQMAAYVNASNNSIADFYNAVVDTDVNRYVASVAILPKLGGPTIYYLTNPVEFVQRVIMLYNKAKVMSNDIRTTTDYSRQIYSAESDQISDMAGRFTNANTRFSEMANSMAQIKTQFETLAKNLPT
jgi:hypothetical protein